MKYGSPYRPPCDGWHNPIRVWFGPAHQHYWASDVFPLWQNVTNVRRKDTMGVITTNNAPFPRFDNGWYNGISGTPACTSLPFGECGTWFSGPGDHGALSAQAVTDMVNDIIACAAPDSTHVTSDHNCYFKTGANRDFRTTHKIGGKWVQAQKAWHGRFGFKDATDPHVITAISCTTGRIVDPVTGSPVGGIFTFGYSDDAPSFPSAPQIKYLTSHFEFTTTTIQGSYGSPTSFNNLATYSSDETVGRYTGIKSGTASGGNFAYDDGGIQYSMVCGWNFNDAILYFCQFSAVISGGYDGRNLLVTSPSAGTYQLYYDDTWAGGTTNILLEEISPSVGAGSRKVYTNAVLIWSETVAASNTAIIYHYEWNNFDAIGGVPHDQVTNLTATVSLHDTYTSADCYADLMTLLAQWDMSDDQVYPWRTDEQLGFAPLVMYDEMGGAVAPEPYVRFVSTSVAFPSMDNYAVGVNDISGNAPCSGGWAATWQQIAWHDPNDYFWSFNGSNNGMPSGWCGGAGAVLNTGLYTGAIISHNRAGSDPHFWFGYVTQNRSFSSGGLPYQWNTTQHGLFTPPPLPATAMRWLSSAVGQYDPDASVFPFGWAWPQAYIHQQGGVIMACKYVENKEMWRSVNFARPYGADKWSIDNPTVCCVLSGSGGSGSLVVTTTNNAIAPNTPGGLQNGDYVQIGGDGVYRVGTISAPSGPGNVGDSGDVGTIRHSICR